MKLYSYNKDEFQFLQILEKILCTKNLNEIHKLYQWNLLERKNDQDTPIHKLYYNNFNVIKSLYDIFIKKVIIPIFNESLVYQKIPTFRIQIPNNLAVGEWHKDKHYNHNEKEVNVFLPFTDAFDTNTIWTESKEDLGDYKPIEAKYGEFVIWNGCHLTHGNKINTTNKTRVSIDFRIIPLSQWKFSSGVSINTKTKFDIGQYYELCKY